MKKEELTEKYFSGRLNEDEKILFQKCLDENLEFRQEIAFLEDLKVVAQKSDEVVFKERLRTFEAGHKMDKKRPKNLWLWSAAAAILIFVSVLYIFSRPYDHQELFAKYFEPAKNVTMPLVRGDQQDQTLTSAFEAYNAGNYEEALTLFSATTDSGRNPSILLYEGNVYLVTGRTEEAIGRFEEHIFSKDSLRFRSYWYLALAHLKNNDPVKARTNLLQLTRTTTFKKKEAEQLLKELP